MVIANYHAPEHDVSHVAGCVKPFGDSAYSSFARTWAPGNQEELTRLVKDTPEVFD